MRARRRAEVVLLATACLLAVLASACGRHVVVDPETAARANDRAWKITSEPAPAAPPPQTSPP